MERGISLIRSCGKLFHNGTGSPTTCVFIPETCDDAIETRGHGGACGRIVEEATQGFGDRGRPGAVLNELGNNEPIRENVWHAKVFDPDKPPSRDIGYPRNFIDQ